MLVVAFAAALIAAQARQSIDSVPPHHPPRTVAIDERFAEAAHLSVGDRFVLSSQPGQLGDTVIVAAITRRGADPAEVARGDYRVRLHLDELQSLIGYGDRVDRFAVATHGAPATDSALRAINASAFGFQAYRSRDVAVETSRTFLVVSRFHRAIGVITIVASAIFLLCIMLLKVDERRRDIAALRLLGVSSRSIVHSVMIEATVVAFVGSGAGVVVGWIASLIINWHYRGVYRTSLAFAVVTPSIILLAVVLSLVLGLVAGLTASYRLVSVPPLELLSGRRETRGALVAEPTR